MRTSTSFAIPVIALFVILAAGMPATAQAGCTYSDKPVRSISKKQARSAIGCLFNKERSAGNVKRHGNLEEAAQNHSAVMAKKKCLSHQCSGEPDLRERVARTGYLRGSNGYELGEIILADKAKRTSRDIVKGWLNSPPHRANLNKSSYNHVGVGVSIRDGLVYATADFGHR